MELSELKSEIKFWDTISARGIDDYAFTMNGVLMLDGKRHIRAERSYCTFDRIIATGKINRDRIEETILIKGVTKEEIPKWKEISRQEIIDEIKLKYLKK